MWQAIILAAGRGPDDPMAKAYGVANKTVIPIGGIPMLARVAEAIRQSGVVESVLIAIEKREIATNILGDNISTIEPAGSAPASVIKAVKDDRISYPVLVTTGDHALLTPEMVKHFCQSTEQSGADVTVGLATKETILAAYPQSIRTFFKLGPDSVSGCNLFGLTNARGLKLFAKWQYLEQSRKKPWRLAAAFGVVPLFRFLTGQVDLKQALEIVSAKAGATVKAVLMPFAEAAIDVDKPADKELAEEILARRQA